MKIVCLGDSVTQGCFEIVKNSSGEWELVIEPESSYVSLLSAMLKTAFPEKNIEVINAGISGESTAEALNRLEKDVISENPDIVTVCLGLNDSGRRDTALYCANLSEIFGRVSQTGAKLIFLTPNMLNTYVDPDTPDYLISMAKNCTDIQNNGYMDELINSGIETVERYGAVICDAYSVWKKVCFLRHRYNCSSLQSYQSP